MKRVYFIAQDEWYVKIGASNDVYVRLRQLQAANPHKLEIKHCIPSDENTESFVHGMFAEYHHRGEWYHFEDKLAVFIHNKMSIKNYLKMFK